MENNPPDADKAINELISVLEMTVAKQEKELSDLSFLLKYNKSRIKKFKAIQDEAKKEA